MKKDLEQIINSSITKLKNCFYKVLTNENGEKFIVEYSGPSYPALTILRNGWKRFPKEFLSDITEDNPYFRFDDYKFSTELDKIVKKSNEDNLRKKLNEINLILQSNIDVFTVLISHIKSIFKLFNINFLEYSSFQNLITNYQTIVNESSLDINEKTDYLVAMQEYVQNIKNELKNIGIFNADKFLEENFKYFFVLI